LLFIDFPETKTQQQQQQQQQQTKSGRVRKVPPKFYSVPHNKIAETGETVRFQCNVGGNPSPRVTWDRDNIAIKPESITPAGRVRIEERDDVRVLEIRNVTSEVEFLFFIFSFFLFQISRSFSKNKQIHFVIYF
jgi:hypothetical protein